MSDSLQPMNCSLPGSSVHGIPQARILVSVLPCPPPGDRPNPGIKAASNWQVSSSSPSHQGNPSWNLVKGKPCFVSYVRRGHGEASQQCPSLFQLFASYFWRGLASASQCVHNLEAFKVPLPISN